MNKADQFRAQIEKANEERKEIEAKAKAEALEKQDAKKIADLPLDIEFVYYLINLKQIFLLQGKEKEAKVVLNRDVQIPSAFIANAPQNIRYHKFNDDNIDEVADLLRKDGFVVSPKIWIHKWESKDIDYPISGGECYSVDIFW